MSRDSTLDTDRDWADPATFEAEPDSQPAGGWIWHQPERTGERGLPARFPAVLMGRAKAWSFEQPLGPEAKAVYVTEQREAVLRALAAYAPRTMAVFDVDLGHTDPQLVIPYGCLVRVDGPARRITVTY